MQLAREFSCLFCNELVDEILIRCEICQPGQLGRQPIICLECFSNGLENEQHKNDHSYRVLNLADVFTFQAWNPHEEIQLNSLASSHRFNQLTKSHENSTLVGRFNADACLKHLETWFTLFGYSSEQRAKKPRLRSTMILYKEPTLSQAESSSGAASIRPVVHSKLFRLTSGYRTARGQFETETRENFEFKYVADMDFTPTGVNYAQSDPTNDDQVIINRLQMSVLHTYKDLIRERQARRKLIRDFGLVSEIVPNTLSSMKANPSYRTNSLQYEPLLKTGQVFSQSTDCASHLHKFNKDSVHFWSLPHKFVRLFADFETYAKNAELLNHFG